MTVRGEVKGDLGGYRNWFSGCLVWRAGILDQRKMHAAVAVLYKFSVRERSRAHVHLEKSRWSIEIQDPHVSIIRSRAKRLHE